MIRRATMAMFACVLIGGTGCDPTGGAMNGDDLTDGNGMTDGNGTGNGMTDGNGEMAIGLSAMLDAGQEVPPAQSNGVGEGTLTLSADRMTLDFIISGLGLTGPITGAHFHIGPAGVAGPVAFDLGPFVFEDAGGVTIVGTAQLADWVQTDDAAADILAGNVYVNLHTSMFPGGEIRGQIEIRE